MSGPDPRRLDVRQEEERISGWKALIAMIVVLAVIVACIWAAIALQNRRDRSIPGSPGVTFRPPLEEKELGPASIRGIRQTSVEWDESTRRLAEEQENFVDTYGWVDSTAGVVHIPVERAIGLLLSGDAAYASLRGASAPADTADSGGAS